MLEEYSFWIIAFYKNNDGSLEFLLINQKSDNGSFWWFPKWHIEEWETWIQAARREFQEEVWITTVDIIGNDTFRTTYVFSSKKWAIKKNVTFFIWEVKNKEVHIQESELNWYKRASFDVAMNLLSHQNYKNILEDVKWYLNC